MRFCGFCGKPITGGPVVPDAAPGERRFLAVLFCDLVGSTAIASRVDPEELRDLLWAYQGAVRDAVREYHGHFARNIGDGAVVYFGWPQAYENDAERAVRTGLSIIEKVDLIDRTFDSDSDLRLAVRIGLHAGLVVIDAAGEVYGDTPNIAARVQAEAPVGTVVITETVARLLDERCNLESIGRPNLKGVPQAPELYQVKGFVDDLQERKSQTPLLVGRERELQVIETAWAATREGRGHRVAVCGEPGIGKSRLVQTFRERTRPPGERWLEMAGSELHSRTPFWPVRQMMERAFGLVGILHTNQKLERMHGDLAAAGVDADQVLPALAALLELPVVSGSPLDAVAPEQRWETSLSAVVDWLVRISRASPLVLLVEDIHWLDPSSLELVRRLAGRSDLGRLMLLVTARSGFTLPSDLDCVLPLAPLDDESIRTIVHGTVTSPTAHGRLLDRLVVRVGGNPLFAQELSRFVAQRGGTLAENDIPTSLAGSLMARLDALGSAKEVAQIGAVLGRAFSRDQILTVSRLPSERLNSELARLVGAGILATAGPGDEQLAFGHAMIRDAAYDALLRGQRRELHARAAEAFEASASASPPQPEIAAHHWDNAGQPGRAAKSWQEAGLAATARGAFQEAEANYQRGLESIDQLPASAERDVEELSLRNLLVGAQQITHGYSSEQVRENLTQVRALTEKIGDASQLMLQAALEWVALSSRGDFSQSSILADKVLELARRVGAPDAMAHAYMIQMTARYRVGDLANAERSFLLGQAFYSARGFKERPGSVPQTFGNAARNAWLLGHLDRARERSQHAIRLSVAANRPYDIAFAEYMAAILAILMRQPSLAKGHAERALELSDAHSFPQFSAISRVVLGRAMVELEEPAEGAALITEGIGRMMSTGSRVAVTLYQSWAAEAAALAGRWEEAMQWIDQALAINPEERFFLPECLRIRGEIQAALGNRVEASKSLGEACRVAQKLDARMCLARVWLSSQRLNFAEGPMTIEFARTLNDTLVEGRDTADLVEFNASVIGGSPLRADML
jgi:class 3 adenylate cyclase/tetratricopeptide (TPR) repeat protein